jgi:hypothetical protein
MNTSYSINRATVGNESLMENLIDSRSNTVVSQKVERVTSKKEGGLGRSGTMAGKSIVDLSRKNDKFNEQTDLRTVLENFMSQPMQFKYNRDHSRGFFINQTKSEQGSKINTSVLEMYQLPEFKDKQV